MEKRLPEDYLVIDTGDSRYFALQSQETAIRKAWRSFLSGTGHPTMMFQHCDGREIEIRTDRIESISMSTPDAREAFTVMHHESLKENKAYVPVWADADEDEEGGQGGLY